MFKSNYICISRQFLNAVYLNNNYFSGRCYSDSPKKVISVVEDESRRVAVVLMQRPPVNGLNTELLQALKSTINELEAKKFKGMILSSSMPTTFSAGLDITEMHNTTEERFKTFWMSLQNMWKTLYLTPLITIAAVNGHAPAGGCLLAASCDYTLMVKSKAVIGLNETSLGIMAPTWFRSLFINTVGFRHAEQALNLGTLFTAEEALALNLVNKLVDNPSDLMTKSQEVMDKWLKIPDLARQQTKLRLRKPFVDELISYEKAEVEETASFVFNDYVQKTLGKYMESLKVKGK